MEEEKKDKKKEIEKWAEEFHRLLENWE